MFDWLDPYWFVIIGVVKAVIIAVAVMSCVPLLVWLERRLLGRFQVRLGPNRVGPLGLGQLIADSLKLLFKESIVQSSADKFLFYLAPAIVVFTSIVTFSVIPFGTSYEVGGETVGLWGSNTNIGLLLFLAMSSMGTYGIVMAGLSSNNKYSLIGGLRSSAQMISYELTLGLTALSIVIWSGSLNLTEIVSQQGNIGGWNIWYHPATFVLFFIAGLAETNRAPFDLPEAEQELVAGFFTEYSGMKFSMFFMGEYINMITMSGLITVLFLGGWHAPVAFLDEIPIIWFVGKVFFLLCVFIWIRATFPRIRYDRLMTFGWKFMVPAALVNMLIYGTIKAVGLI